jgi:dolichol-phosphate mannosyltransferase|tara:strand:- start:2730 stop:3701 length:972 start_codon:yes stop_codon:yes gene_type:complete
MPKLSIIFPVFNEESNLRPLYSQITEVCDKLNMDYEMIFVDNGSHDLSLKTIRDLKKSDGKVKYISLSRNFGHQGGLFAGMSYASGEAIITMDADLQHPPDLIPTMLSLWNEGYQIVNTTKKQNHMNGIKGIQVRLFYWLISRMSGVKLSFGQSDFRLIDRKALDILLTMPERRKFIRGIVNWIGFSQTSIQYSVAERLTGQSKFSYRSLFSFALDGIFSFSTLPLRFFIGLGTSVALLSLLYAVIAASLGIAKYVYPNLQLPPGWATLAVAISFLGSVQLIAIGVLGEYVGRIYEQTKGRPTFIVSEKDPDIKSIEDKWHRS